MMPYLKSSITILCHLYNYTRVLDLVEITLRFPYMKRLCGIRPGECKEVFTSEKYLCCVIFMDINSIIKYNC